MFTLERTFSQKFNSSLSSSSVSAVVAVVVVVVVVAAVVVDPCAYMRDGGLTFVLESRLEDTQ